jgi:hypothetical protein
MPSSGILRLVALVITYISEESTASIIRVTKISELGTTLSVTSNRSTLWINTRTTWRNNPEDDILHSHRRENLRSYGIFAVHCSLSGQQQQQHFTARGDCRSDACSQLLCIMAASTDAYAKPPFCNKLFLIPIAH